MSDTKHSPGVVRAADAVCRYIHDDGQTDCWWIACYPIDKYAENDYRKRADIADIIARETAMDRAGFLMVARSAVEALRSYQYGNSSPDLAEEIADALEAAIAKAEA